MKIYLAGPMAGYKDFNFPAFHKAAADLRVQGHTVFSPAEKDEEQHGAAVSNSTAGDPKDAEKQGFDIRVALYNDFKFICLEANAIALLPGWEASAGACAEWGAAKALNRYLTEDERLEFIYL